jgi:hypothetical protein
MEVENQPKDSERKNDVVGIQRPKSLDKPLRCRQDSVHVPGHILLPLSTLMAHPYPGAVHPFENQGERSVSDMRSISDSQYWSSSPALWNHNDFYFNTSEMESASIVMVNDRRRFSLASIGGDLPKRSLIVAALPILPFQAAIVCLIFNILIPGQGKLLIYMAIVRSLLLS